MDDRQADRIASLLEQVRDNQAEQLRHQAESLALQKEQFALVRSQAERNERIQDRAEALQSRGMDMMKVARRALAIVLPIVFLLILYLSWLLFR